MKTTSGTMKLISLSALIITIVLLSIYVYQYENKNTTKSNEEAIEVTYINGSEKREINIDEVHNLLKKELLSNVIGIYARETTNRSEWYHLDKGIVQTIFKDDTQGTEKHSYDYVNGKYTYNLKTTSQNDNNKSNETIIEYDEKTGQTKVIKDENMILSRFDEDTIMIESITLAGEPIRHLERLGFSLNEVLNIYQILN